MTLLVSVCDISWWMIVLSLIVPAVLAWLLANQFAKDKNEDQRQKIKQLQAELKKCYSDKQTIKTKLVAPIRKFSELGTDQFGVPRKGTTTKYEGDKTQKTNKRLQQNSKGSRKNENKSIANIRPKYSKLQDNFEVIEGVGPKMSEILTSNGIETWSSLADKSVREIKAILDKYGDRYRIIDPKTWPIQAELAHQNQWDKLIAHQEAEGGKGGKKSKSKVSKLLIKYGYIKKFKQDDLKAIEGIGPKIASLLNDAGINTWNQLATTKTKDIQTILEKAGKRYALATPDSWPAQAKLAAEGNFGGLELLQSKLKGGK